MLRCYSDLISLVVNHLQQCLKSASHPPLANMDTERRPLEKDHVPATG